MMSSKSFIFNRTIKGSTLHSIWSQPGAAVEQPLLSNCWGGKEMEEREVLKLLFISATVQEEIEVGGKKKVFTVRLEADLLNPQIKSDFQSTFNANASATRSAVQQ